jgi:hypothetical protein
MFANPVRASVYRLQESFPPGRTQVFTPNLGSTYLLSTYQATTIAITTIKPFMRLSFSVPVV